jgi:hypothetical protein
MFTPRRPIYTYNSPPVIKPSPLFAPSCASKSSSFPPASTFPYATRPPSPEKKHPVQDLFGDAVFSRYRAGLGYLPTPPATPQPSPPSYQNARPAPAPSPLRAGCGPHLAPGASPAQSAKLRASRARAKARVDEGFRNARAQSSAGRLGRSASWLRKADRKQSRLHGESLLGQKRREEHKRRIVEARKRAQEEARKSTEEARRRAKLEMQKAEEERKKAAGDRWASYAAQWEWIMSLPADLQEHQMLTSRHLPFPLAADSNPMTDLTKPNIEAFLMDQRHSEGKTRRERVRAALLIVSCAVISIYLAFTYP